MSIKSKVLEFFGQGEQAAGAPTSTLEMLRAHYTDLCAKRDAVNERVAPMLAAREVLNQEANVAADKARAISEEINDIRGGQAWIDLKRDIGVLARALSGK